MAKFDRYVASAMQEPYLCKMTGLTLLYHGETQIDYINSIYEKENSHKSWAEFTLNSAHFDVTGISHPEIIRLFDLFVAKTLSEIGLRTSKIALFFLSKSTDYSEVNLRFFSCQTAHERAEFDFLDSWDGLNSILVAEAIDGELNHKHVGYRNAFTLL